MGCGGLHRAVQQFGSKSGSNFFLTLFSLRHKHFTCDSNSIWVCKCEMRINPKKWIHLSIFAISLFTLSHSLSSFLPVKRFSCMPPCTSRDHHEKWKHGTVSEVQFIQSKTNKTFWYTADKYERQSPIYLESTLLLVTLMPLKLIPCRTSFRCLNRLISSFLWAGIAKQSWGDAELASVAMIDSIQLLMCWHASASFADGLINVDERRICCSYITVDDTQILISASAPRRSIIPFRILLCCRADILWSVTQSTFPWKIVAQKSIKPWVLR